MGWLYGIPDVSLTNHFVYFNNLLDTTFNATNRKYEIGKIAQNLFVSGMSSLETADIQINQAVDFIQKIAQHERTKEISAVQAYCQKNKIDFPAFKDKLNPKFALEDPETFYLTLTKLINEERLGTQRYLDELKRIKANAEGAKTKLSDYFTNDARYRVAGDARSFLRKLIGNYQENKNTDDTYAQKLQEIVLDIINETIGEKINSAEDFAAIGVAILTDIENKAQKKLEENGLNDFTELMKDNMLEEIKNTYLKEISQQKKEEQTAIQQALNNYDKNGFDRIIRNVKDIFGITTLDKNSNEYQKQLIEIKKQAARRSKDTKQERQAVSKIRNRIKNKKMRENFQQINFTKLDYKTQHGNAQELVVSFLEENGLTVGKRGSATDILSVFCNYEVKPDDKIIEEFLEEIGDELNNIYLNDDSSANNRDLRKSISTMNENIDVVIAKLEEKLKELNNNNLGDFFIFHESLKLYSSIETGVNKKFGESGFGGRNMNILSYIDFMLSACDAAGISTPANRELLIFLALNLSELAIGRGNSDPLAKYFSIFAGLLMFDDVVNMAKEATQELPESSIKQVHLYNLNGVYVPASMVLSYVSDALQLGAQEATYAATASINSSGATKAINDWENPEHLRPEHWQKMGAAVASGTKVKIAFMSAFLSFITNLSKL